MVDVYETWAARMRALGGQIAALPSDPKPLYVEGHRVPRAAAVFRDPEIWGPLVNAKRLPLPTDYGRQGRFAYFVAPDDVQVAARKRYVANDLRDATAIERGTAVVLSRWSDKVGVPLPTLDGVKLLVRGLLVVLVLLVAANVVNAVRRASGAA